MKIQSSIFKSFVIATFFFSLASEIPGQENRNESTESVVSLESLQGIHREAAEEYSFELDGRSARKIELVSTPLTQWTNSRRMDGQLGHVYVWVDEEEPVAIAAIFSFPWRGDVSQRRVVHELHALSPSKLSVRRSGPGTVWDPERGLERRVLPVKPIGVFNEGKFKIAIRRVGREFTGYCLESNGKKWELRILPTPLMVYRFERDGTHGYGAILGMMGDIGNDLECGVLLEASTLKDSKQVRWSFAPIRMTDKETFLSFEGQGVWEDRRSATNTSWQDSAKLYFRFPDKTVPIES